MMFAVIYRAYIKPGYEQEYQNLWNKIACYFVEHRSAIGSCLHRSTDGLWVVYSRWPDKATWRTSWPGDHAPSEELPDDIRNAVLRIKDCFDQERKLPEICLEVVEDLLIGLKN
jgi:hypothetical protein